MAYRVENPIPTGIYTDYQVAVGVSLPFVGSTTSGSDAVFASTYTSTEQIRSNLINFMLTNKGERIENVNYGGDLRKYVFSGITENSYAFGVKGTNNINHPAGWKDSQGNTTPIPNVQPYTNMGIRDFEAQLTNDIKANFPQLQVYDLTINPNPDTNYVNVVLTYSFMRGPNNQIILNV